MQKISKTTLLGRKLIIYDGVCVFCSGFIHWVYKNNHGKDIFFTTMQAKYGQEIAEHFGIDPSNYDTIIYAKNGTAHFKSDAILHIMSELKQPWPIVKYAYAIFPHPIRDMIYNLIARNRYKLFGKAQQCIIPDKQVAARMLD